MARKNVLKPYRLETAKSLATSFQLTGTNIQYLDNIAFIIKTSGVTDNTGSFGVDIRYTAEEGNLSTDWISLTLSSSVTLNDADDEFYIYLNGLVATECRLTFTADGGTPDGTAEIWVSGNQVGG